MSATPDSPTPSVDTHPRVRFRPEAIRPVGTNLEHAAVLSMLLLMCVAAILIGVLSLPMGALAFLVLIPALAWAWLAWQAIHANSHVEALRARGHIVTGMVSSVNTDEDGYCVAYAYEVTPLDEEGDTLDLSGECRGLSQWMSLRYEADMRVAVMIDPDIPTKSTLYPPPGGGGTIDLLGDCFVWALRRVNTPRADSSSGPPTSTEDELL